MEKYNLKQYAHLGDAVWELFIRKIVIDKINTQRAMHEATTNFVRAEFQANTLDKIAPYLTGEENTLVKRGGNLPLTAQKRKNQNIHRRATAFEVLIGALYLNNPPRLDEIFEIILKNAL